MVNYFFFFFEKVSIFSLFFLVLFVRISSEGGSNPILGLPGGFTHNFLLK